MLKVVVWWCMYLLNLMKFLGLISSLMCFWVVILFFVCCFFFVFVLVLMMVLV